MRVAILIGAACIAALGCLPEQPEDAAADAFAPRVRLRLSGELEGRLEPCGCASGQMGGLARRAFLLLQDRNYDLLIEGGNLTVAGDELDELKLMTMLAVLSGRAPYQAIGLGQGDLRMATEPLGALFQGFGIPTLASDLVAEGAKVRTGELPWPGVPYTENAVGDTTVRIASLALAVPSGEGAAAYGFRLLAPEAAWRRAMKGVDPSSLRILLVHGPDAKAREAAKLTPRPDLIVAINAASPEPPTEAEIVDGVPLVNPGTRGRYVVDVTLARVDGAPQVRRYRPIGLRGSQTAKGAMEDRDVKSLLLAHRHEVAQEGIREVLAGRRPTPNGHDYVGSKTCMPCHLSAFRAWEKSAHSHAWETLEKAEAGDRYGWPVTHYPDCVACHTVGYRQRSGFVSPEKTPDLRSVGCEECHGPGAKHSIDPQQRLGAVPVTKCNQCHDFEQSPDFDYEEKWAKIEHGK